MSVLIVDSDDSYVSKLALHLGNQVEGEVHCRENPEQANSLIDLLDDFSFIITKDFIDGNECAQKVIDHISGNSELTCKPSIIVLGSKVTPVPEMNTLVIPESTKVKQIAHIIESQKEFDSSKKELQQRKKVGYVPVPIKLLNCISKTPVDIFLKMKKEGNISMLKRFSSGDALEQADLLNLGTKGVRSFYVSQTDKKTIYQLFNSRIAELTKSVPDEFLSSAELENYAFHTLHNIGLSESSLKVASLTVKGLEENLNKSSNLKKGLKDLLGNPKIKFKQANSKCISLISHYILKNISWGSSKLLESIHMAALLHDFALNDEESKIRDQQELDAQFFEDSVNIKIDKHAQVACQKLESSSFISSEVIKLIRQHHGSLEGKGFSNKLESNLGQLSFVFIVAEEISVRLLTSEREKVNISALLEEVSEKFYGNSQIQEVIEAFKGSLKSN